jgi:capsular polysaccharide transport system permease protein
LTIERTQPLGVGESPFAVQYRVVAALMWRDIHSKNGRSRLGYVWELLNPVLHLTILVAVFTWIERNPPFGTSIAVFFATGVLPFLLFSHLSGGLITAISSNKSLLTIPIIRHLDTVIARAALIAATSLTATVMIFSGFILYGLNAYPIDLLRAMYGFLAMGLLGIGIGSVNAVLGAIFLNWAKIYGVFTIPLYILSGILRIPELMPINVRDVMVWNPALHGVTLFRQGFYAGYGSETLDVNYLLGWGLGSLAVGLLAERILRRRMMQV